MRVLMVNGSPHAKGNTYVALDEMKNIFEAEDIEVDYVHIGHLPIRGCIGCGQCEEIVCFTPEGALSGQPIVTLDVKSNNILRRLKKEKEAQMGKISWWEIYSTQQEVDAAVARMKRAHRTKIVKIEMNIVIN